MLLIAKQICPDTKRELKIMIDTEEVILAREEILHEIEGYDEDDMPKFKEGGEVSSVCSVVFRNSHSLRLHDPNLILLNEILDAKINNYSDGYKEVFLGEDLNYEATNASPSSIPDEDEEEDDDGDVEFIEGGEPSDD